VTNKLPKSLKINESVLKKMEVGLECCLLLSWRAQLVDAKLDQLRL
jgi:hypothetical protein